MNLGITTLSKTCDCSSSYINNNSNVTSIFSWAMKLFRVIPLFRKNEPKDLANFRPIFSLRYFSKIFIKKSFYVRQ